MATITMNAVFNAIKNVFDNYDITDGALYEAKNANGETTYVVTPDDVVEWFEKQAAKQSKAAERSKAKAAEKRAETNAAFKAEILEAFAANDNKPMTFSDIADAVEDIPTWQKAMAVVKTYPDTFEIVAGKKKKEVHVIGVTTTTEE